MGDYIDFGEAAAARERERARERAAGVAVPYPPRREEREVGRLREQPTVSLTESYLTQRLRVPTATGAVDVIPSPAGGTADLPFLLPAHVLSAWNPVGRAETPARSLRAGAVLRSHVAAMALEYVPTATFAPDRSWAEESVVVEGLPDVAAVSLARMLSQPAVVRVDEDGLHVLPTGLGDVRSARVAGFALVAASTTCPMRLDTSGAECRNPGGPYTSRSMEVGHVWAQHRQLLLTLLGCTACEQGRRSTGTGGGPIALSEVFVSSRFGGWQYGRG